jgi:hypothetical protein
MTAVPTQVPQDTPAPAAPKPAAPTAPMPAHKTQAEYDAIPKGTKYMDTDGKEKIKG